MKRKLLNGTLILAALASVGTLPSCKDYDSFELEQKQQNKTFADKLNAIQADLDKLSGAHDAFETATNLRLDKLEQDLAAVMRDYITEAELKQALADFRATLSECGCMSEEALKQLIKDMTKDFVTDTELQSKVLNIMDQTIKDVALLQSQMTTVQNSVTSLENQVNAINVKIAELEKKEGLTAEEAAEIAAAEAEKVFDAKIEEVYLLIEQANQFTTQVLGILNDEMEAVNNKFTDITNTLDAYELRLSTTEQNAIDALVLAKTNTEFITNLQENYIPFLDAAKQELPGLISDVETLKQDWIQLQATLQNIDSRLFDCEENIEELQRLVQANADAIAELQGLVNKVAQLNDRLNQLITGVLVQRTYNPLFGTFSLPIGIQSNMLLGYYGVLEAKNIDFPSNNNPGMSYNGENPLTDAEVQMLENSGFNMGSALHIDNGEYLKDNEMGELYVTINPINRNFTGTTLSLVRSNGKDSGLRLEPVTESQKELSFGAGTRSGNGFYEMKVQMPVNGVGDVAFKAEDGLKEAMKDALKNHTRRDLFNLMKEVYNQISVGLPAYGVKAEWKDGDSMNGVVSNYDIAAVAFSPLSYSTYYGQTVDKKLPTYGPIDASLDFINSDEYHFDLSDIKFELDASKIEVSFNLEKLSYDQFNKKFFINLKGVTFKDEDGNEWTVAEDTIVYLDDQSIKDFVDTMNGQIDIWNQQMEDEFFSAMNQLADQIQEQVDDVLKDLEGNINDRIDEIVADIKDEISGKTDAIFNRVNKFIDLYNRVAEKINGWLENPNHLLQPVMLFNSNGNLHRFSNNQNDPSVFNQAGGDALTLYLTSYSGEILAPAYKKFVFVSNAWDAQGKEDAAAAVAVNKAGNAQGHLMQILPGKQHRCAMPTSAMKTGYTYEIVYMGLDYHGYTSTQHFYIKVK